MLLTFFQGPVLAQKQRTISASDLESLKSAQQAEGSQDHGAGKEPLFHDMTRAIVWGMQSRAVQVIIL